MTSRSRDFTSAPRPAATLAPAAGARPRSIIEYNEGDSMRQTSQRQTRQQRWPLALLIVAGSAASSAAQCLEEWISPPFGQYSTYGTDMPVDASTTWLAPGEARPRLVIAGRFNTVAGGSFSRIATWDGSRWLQLGSGINGGVHDIIDFNGTLVATGLFTSAGGVAVQNIARWTGASWQPMGSLNDYGSALAIHNGFLFVGGVFTQASGVSANRLARWNGAAWQAVNAGLNGPVRTLTTAQGPSSEALIIGGEFTTANGNPANRIAGYSLNFSPNFWYALGSGVNGPVLAVSPGPGGLYVGGTFTSAGGLATGSFARWNETLDQWQVLGGFFNGPIYSLEPYTDPVSKSARIAIGGLFPGINNSPNIAFYSPQSGYTTPGSGGGTGMNGSVFTMTSYNSSLVIGGAFSSAGGVFVQNLARWSGNPADGWSALRPGASGPVLALLPTGSGLYAGGDFQYVIDSTTTARNIVSTNGVGLGPVTHLLTAPNGTNGPVRALAFFSTNPLLPSRLIAGGVFTQAGGLNATNIAQFDLGGWSPLGSGVNGPVNALRQFGTSLIAAGEFTSASGVANTSGVARWGGGVWNAMGTGLVGSSGNALEFYSGELYLGGNFFSAGGVAAPSIARWNGSAWQSVPGAILNGTVRALKAFNTQLIVAGDFSSGGPVLDRVAAWNGSAWSAMHAGLPAAAVFTPTALALHQGDLYLGGMSPFTDGPRTIYRWSGAAWTLVDGSPNRPVYTLASAAGALWAGGDFGVAGGHATPYLGQFKCECFANCDNSSTPPILNVADFTCFLQTFAAGDSYANCDQSTTPPVLNVADFTCFLQRFAAGCP